MKDPYREAVQEFQTRAELDRKHLNSADSLKKMMKQVSAETALGSNKVLGFFSDPCSVYYDRAIRREHYLQRESLKKLVDKQLKDEEQYSEDSSDERRKIALREWQEKAEDPKTGSAEAQAVSFALNSLLEERDVHSTGKSHWQYIAIGIQLCSIVWCFYNTSKLWSTETKKSYTSGVLGLLFSLFVMFDQIKVLAFAQVVRMLPVWNGFLYLALVVQLLLPAALMLGLNMLLAAITADYFAYPYYITNCVAMWAVAILVYNLDAIVSCGISDFQHYAVELYVSLLNCPRNLGSVRDSGTWNNGNLEGGFSGGVEARIELPLTKDPESQALVEKAMGGTSEFLASSEPVKYYDSTGKVVELPGSWTKTISWLSYALTFVVGVVTLYRYSKLL
jgi:hypothetical protein